MDSTAPRILFVDDHQVFRRVLTQILEDEGYAVVQEGKPEAAQARIQSDAEHFDAVICDVMSGRVPVSALLRSLRVHRPRTPVLVISGYARDEAEARLGERGFEFLQKPILAEDLVARLRAAMRGMRGVAGSAEEARARGRHVTDTEMSA